MVKWSLATLFPYLLYHATTKSMTSSTDDLINMAAMICLGDIPTDTFDFLWINCFSWVMTVT